MRYYSLILASIAAFIFFSEEALAHKVNVFAFVDGDEIQVECSFSRSQKVKNGKLIITDLVTGDLVLEGITDERGMFRFRPSDNFLSTGHGLNIRLLAGEGHQDEWKVSAEDLRSLSRTDRNTPLSQPNTQNTPTLPQSTEGLANAETVQLSGIDAAELEAIIGRVLDEKLSPIRQTLARQQNDEPGLREIIGGIGWILGLLGIATYMKYRHRK